MENMKKDCERKETIIRTEMLIAESVKSECVSVRLTISLFLKPRKNTES